MKLQTIFFLTGIAAGLMAVSCQTTADEDAEAFFGRPAPNKAKAESDADKKAASDYYAMVNAHIDRRMNEYNEKEEAKLPVYTSKEAKAEFMELSFIKSAEQLSMLSIDFSGSGDSKINLVFDRESRIFTRTIDGNTEEFRFEPFTNGIAPDIPADAHILYAFVTDFNRIAETITLRCHEELKDGENPAIAKLANESNLDKNGKKIDKSIPEITPEVIQVPNEYRIDNRWCQCYDVKLKSICAPFVSMAVFVSNELAGSEDQGDDFSRDREEKTISRLDVISDDDQKTTFIIDWRRESKNAREQDGSVLSRTTDDSTNQDLQGKKDGIVLPLVIRRFGENPTVFFREDANVILKSQRAQALADALAEEAEAAAAENEAAEEGNEAAGQNGEESEGEAEEVEFDLSGDGFEEE